MGATDNTPNDGEHRGRAVTTGITASTAVAITLDSSEPGVVAQRRYAVVIAPSRAAARTSHNIASSSDCSAASAPSAATRSARAKVACSRFVAPRKYRHAFSSAAASRIISRLSPFNSISAHLTPSIIASRNGNKRIRSDTCLRKFSVDSSTVAANSSLLLPKYRYSVRGETPAMAAIVDI